MTRTDLRQASKKRGGQSASASQLFNFVQDSYLERTSRPVYAAVFLLPFIIFYEVGTLLINTDVLSHSQVRVVAFVWLQDALEFVGFSSRFAWAAPAVVVLVILGALQLTSGKKWKIYGRDFWAMGVECVMLALPLIVLTLFLNTTGGAGGEVSGMAVGPATTCAAAAGRGAAECQSVVGGGGSIFANIVTGIGAGIYEELVFRLILIVLLMLLFQDFLLFEHRLSVVLSVVLSAALFSAHHHIVFVAGHMEMSAPFTFREFVFRTLAGVYFACLFAIRGFGITAGTHAFYDIIAVLVNAVFFS